MEHASERSAKKRFFSPLLNRPGSLPFLLVILLLAVLFFAGPELRSAKHVFEPPWLLFALNAVFITGLCFVIAGLCFRSFLRGGFLNILLLGCGVLAFGLSSFAAGWLIRPPYGPNYTVTIHNIGVFCASVLYFLSSLVTAVGISMGIEHRRGLVAVMAYIAIFILGAILTAETVLQFIPPFFVIGEGPTVIRQVILAVSVTLLTVSALLITIVYSERQSGFLLYFITALLLLGAGLIGVALGAPGSPLGWLGRTSQYLGNICLVVAATKALGEAKSRGTTVETALAAFFRKSEEHYKNLVEMAADAIFSIDRAERIIMMNPAAEKIFGYGQGEAVGQNLAELIVPGQSQELFLACLYGDPSGNIEMDLMRKGGAILSADISFSREMRSGGGVTRTIIIRDVTKRRQAEEIVERAALFPIQNPEPVLRIHRDGTLLFSNPAAGTVLAEWRTASGIQFPDWVRQAVKAALNEGAPRDFEIHIAGRDFSFVVTPIVEDQYANLYGWDVSDRKRAEAALQESEARYRGLFESMNEGSALYELLYDENGQPCDYRFLDVNPAFERLTGLKRKEVIGKTVFEVMPGTEPLWIKRYGELVLTGTPAHFESHSSALGRDYEVFAYRPAAGQFAVVFLDISERKQTEEALRQSREELEQKVRERTADLMLTLEDLEKSRNDLRKLASELVLAEERERKKISVVLHDEVAQTLAAARMRIDLLRNRPGDDDSRRALDEAQQLLVQAIRETRSLMTDISNPVLYDMGLQVAVEALAEEVTARQGLSVSCSFGGRLRNLTQDMEVMIFQVVKELVQNIVKHSRARNASIRLVEERDAVRAVVADDGLGFDAGNVGAGGAEGGFGLFSIRERVKSYDGKITIESAPGRGSEVTIVLPKAAGSPSASGKVKPKKKASDRR